MISSDEAKRIREVVANILRDAALTLPEESKERETLIDIGGWFWSGKFDKKLTGL